MSGNIGTDMTRWQYQGRSWRTVFGLSASLISALLICTARYLSDTTQYHTATQHYNTTTTLQHCPYISSPQLNCTAVPATSSVTAQYNTTTLHYNTTTTLKHCPYISSPHLNWTALPGTSHYRVLHCNLFFIEFDTDLQQGPPLLTQLCGLLCFLWPC